MNEKIREQILFVLDDDKEVMKASLESDLDEENKRMNRCLIDRYRQITGKVKQLRPLSQDDLQVIKDANQIHVNDADNLNGRHDQALELNEWLEQMTELSLHEAVPADSGAFDKHGRCLR
jgi:hypothetical protein